jgi:hypothetical protein
MAWCLVKHRDNFNFYVFIFTSVGRNRPEGVIRETNYSNLILSGLWNGGSLDGQNM